MKLWLVATIALIAGHSLCAADLTGEWGVTPAPANNEIAYYITATGNTFTGYLTQGQNNSAITDGKVDGDNVTFTIMRGDVKINDGYALDSGSPYRL